MSTIDQWPVPVTMKQHDFLTMMTQLATQSEGCREAGAFLLSSNDVRTKNTAGAAVVAVEYYSDLDPTSLTGGITFHASGYTRLNRICRDKRLRVVGDIHLHPGSWTRQSQTDADHPMAARAGHLALIAPHFGAGVRSPRRLGAHLKTANDWESFADHDVDIVFRVYPTVRGALLRVRSFFADCIGRMR
jgi:proteasome lid subunit RPN8/RPN11